MGNKPKTILERLSHAYQTGRGVRMSPADVIELMAYESICKCVFPIRALEPEPGPLGVGTTEDLRAAVDSVPPQVSKYEID